jgi:hypothetical protein
MFKLQAKRGLSEVVGAILIAIIVLAMSMSWIILETQTTTKQTTSIIDIIRTASKSQTQSLSLAYYYKQDNNLHLYLYNYGTENSTPKLALINQNIVYYQTNWTFNWYIILGPDGEFGQQIGQTTHPANSYTLNATNKPTFTNQYSHVGYQATTTLYITNTTTTITIQTSDGMEVYIDNQPVFSKTAYHTQPTTTYTTTIPIQAGTHQITTKYYQWEHDLHSSFSATNTTPDNSLSLIDMQTQTPTNTITPKSLVKLTLPAPETSNIELLLTTIEGGFFTWKLVV